MKKTKKVLVFLLCTLMTTTAFCAVPLSVSAEEEEEIEPRVIISEVLTEDGTENSLNNENTEVIDAVNENSSDSVGGYSKNEKSVANTSGAVNDSVTSSVSVTSISLSQSSLTLGVGETYTLSKTISPSNATATYRWACGNSNIASVSSSGKITAKREGTTTVVVVTNNGKQATCKVTVKKAPTSITISKPSSYIGNGESVTITESTNSGSYANSFTWSSSNSAIVSVKKGSGNKAIITSHRGGSATISVKTYNGVTASFKATVKKAPDSISLSENELNLDIGDKFTISEQTNAGTYANNFTWSSTNSSVASVVKSSSNKAIITAKKAGTAYIKVTTYNGKVDTCKVTVREDTAEDYINEVIELTNAERKKVGLPALSKRADVTKAAQARAKELTVKFSHTRPDGGQFFTIIDDYNINYTRLGENIATGYSTPESVVEGWMASEGHKKNILNSEFEGIGVGYYVEDGVAYWVQIMIT
ncbi:MAG: Ig-like domain-containing protein [Acutalibacteraceae bacterium]|nr:Ig-like domain-containing protein [Acutalibacteraceae bacterium]